MMIVIYYTGGHDDDCDILHPDHPSKAKYKLYKSQYDKIKRQSKMEYYSKLIQDVKQDIRKTWKMLNNLIGKKNYKSSIINSFLVNGH